MKLHHVGYLTKNLQDTRREFALLGFWVEQEAAFDPLRKLDIAFLRNGAYRVELVEPKGEASPLFPLLKKYQTRIRLIIYAMRQTVWGRRSGEWSRGDTV